MSNTGWKEVRLEDICTDVYSGGTPKSNEASFYDGDIPWLNTKEVNFGRIHSTEKNITQKGYDNSSAKWVPANAVIVAMYGATAGRVAISKIELTTNQACCNLIINPEKADYNFVYYFLLHNYKHIASMANGGAQQNLNAGQIKDYKIPLPPLAEQQRIASILSSLDDKIELNNKINRNLKEQAQALFKNWFVDFEPFGGKMPEDWKEGILADIAKYEKEKISISELTEATYYSTENMLPEKAGVGSATNLPNIGQTTRCYPGETIISNIRPYFKKIYFCSEDIAGCSADVLCFKPKNQLLSIFNYCLLYSDSFFDYMMKGSKGTKMPRGDKSQIMNYETAIPSEKVLKDFDAIVAPMLKHIKNNREEIQRLTELRDSSLIYLIKKQP